MRNASHALVVACTAAFLICHQILASVHFTSQSSVTSLTFNQIDFLNARLDAATTLASIADRPGDATTIGWGYYQNPLQNQYLTVTGGVTVENVGIGSGIIYTVRHITGTPGTHTYHYTRVAPDSPTFTTGSVGGLMQLHYQSNATPAVPAGAPYTLTMTMPGDWSSHGTGPGQSELLALNSDWTMLQDFVFDGTLTTVSMSRNAGGLNGPGISFNLHSVPSPGGVSCLGLGLCGLIRRRRA